MDIIKIKNEFRRIKFIDYSFYYMQEYMMKNQFYGAYSKNESLNQFYELEEPSQMGVQLTAQLSHCFYSYLKYYANDYLEKKESFLKIKTKRDSTVNESYDLTLIDTITNQEYLLEIKLSQNKNSWQGSTSTTSKVENFLLINMNLDRDKPLSMENNDGLFNGVFAAIVHLGDRKWDGEAKSNNHRTKFEFRISEWDLESLQENSIVKGGLVPKKVKYHLQLEQIEYGIIE